MTQILDNYGQPCDEAYHDVLSHYQGRARLDERSGPCDDDCENTAPFIDGMPDGTHPDEFLSRPLNFEGHQDWEYRQRRQREHDEGVLQSLYASDMDALLKRSRREMQTKRGQPREDHDYSKLYKQGKRQ